jgi:putative ABC transport system substrate-binding protein
MRRREFIIILSGAVAWSFATHAQQPDRMRRIGVLLPATADDSEYPTLVKAFVGQLQQLGWTEGRKCGSTSAGLEVM